MNSPNEFNENRLIPASVWAEIVDRLSQDSPDDHHRSPNQVVPGDLCNAEIDDLELDGQLRTLGRINCSCDPFVQRVMNDVDNNTQEQSLSIPQATDEGSPCDCDGPGQAATTTSTMRDRLNVGTVILVTGSLGLSLFIAFSVFDWTSDALNDTNSKTALIGSEELSKSFGLISDLNGIDRSGSIDSVEKFSRTQFETANIDVNKQLLTQPKSIDDLFPGGIYAESEFGPIDGNEIVSNVEAKLEKNEKKPADNQFDKSIPAPVVKIIPETELDWKLTINFDTNGVGAIKLNGDKISETLISDNSRLLLLAVATEVKRRFTFVEPRLGKRLKGVIKIGETNFYFDDATKLNEAMELACTQIDRLGFENFRSGRMMKLRARFRLVHNLIDHARDGLDLAPDGVENALDNARGGLAQAIDAQVVGDINRSKTPADFASIDLMNRKGFFYYDDESHLILEIVAKTEKALQKMAVDRLAWEKLNNIKRMKPDDASKRLAQEKKLDNTPRISISRQAFHKFSKSGKLVLPPSHNSFANPGIQNLNPLQLKRQLSRATASFDIFRNLKEFQSAQNFVISETQAWKSEPRLVEFNEKINVLHQKLRSVQKDQNKRQLLTRINAMQTQLHEIRTEAFEPLEELLSKRPELEGLPLVMGEECHLDTDSASTMAQVSSGVGAAVSRFDGFGSRDISQNDVWRYAIIKKEIEKCFRRLEDREQVLKTIDQILQIDHPRLRLELVETLRQQESPAGIEMLVKRAKYDLVPEIRQAATNALSDYSFEKFRGQLLDGLRYPWHVAAQHSAEALVRLDDQDAVPELVEMLKLADPRLPKKVDEDMYVQRELVAVNHMRNCMLCHAPSRSESDLARGLTPSWDRPIPTGYYHAEPTGAFVRADVIYLRQDFSVLQPVKNNGPWPKEQRFDYLVQNKKLSEKHAQNVIKTITKGRNLNREAIVYALRELTDQQPVNDSYKTWLAIAEKRKTAANKGDKRKLD